MTPLRLTALFFLLLAGCPKSGSTKMEVPSIVHRAQSLADNDRMAAIALLEGYLAGPTKSPEVVPWARLWAGEQRRLSGDPKAARRWFESLATKHPTHALKGAAQLGMAVVDAESSLSGNVLATLSLINDTGVPDSLNADRHRILARVGADEGLPMSKVRGHVRRALEYGRADATVEARIAVDLADLISQDDANRIGMAQSAEKQALSKARRALANGDFTTAQTLAEQFLHTWPATAHALEMKYITQRAKAKNPSTAAKVGVLLPLSGNYAPAAARVKAAIELSNQTHGGALTLVFADNKGTKEETATQIARLVVEQGCVALMGPLLKDNAEVAAEHAQALRTPLLALTHSGDPTSAGDFVFRGFLPMKQQIDTLLDHAVNQEGHRRFAIMHPRNGYGNRARDLFGAGVEKRGGKIVSVIGYETDTTDYRTTAKQLAETTLDDASRADLIALRAAAVRRGRDPLKIKVPNNLTFDAIFIPDGYERLVLVASALAYEDFPISRFGRGKAGKPVQLLGLNAWSDPSLAQSGGQYVWGSVFVDAFHSSSYAPSIQQFVTLFEDAYGYPPEVTDALAWDAIRLITPAVQKGRADREAIRTAMTKVRITGPVAGGGNFLPSREVERKLQILTVKPKGIEQWMMGGGDEEE